MRTIHVSQFFALATGLLAAPFADCIVGSANVSAQIVPAGTTTSTQCPSTAPAEAQAAGFTTLVLCHDFTQALPNTAGGAGNPQGTTTNWMGCTSGPGQIWYFGTPQEGGVGCWNYNQEIDPETGQLALHVTFLQSQWHAGPNNLSVEQIQMDDLASHDIGVGNYTTFPQSSLIEITTRDNISGLANPNTIPPGVCDNSAVNNWAVMTHEGVEGTGQNEFDILEHWNGGGNYGQCAPANADGALHNWDSGDWYASCLWNMDGSCGNSFPAGMQQNANWLPHLRPDDDDQRQLADGDLQLY
jgi:hypothetical protein